MQKNTINYIIDMGLALSFLVCMFTGIIKFPGWGLALRFYSLPGMISINLNWFHDWSGILMGVLVLAHLILHWNWIVAMTKKKVFRMKVE